MTKRTRDRAEKSPDAISEVSIATQIKRLRKRHTTEALCRAYDGEIDPRHAWQRVNLWLTSGYRTMDQIDAACKSRGCEPESEYVTPYVPSENEIARIHGRHRFREEPHIDAIFRQARRQERSRLRRRGTQMRVRATVNVCRPRSGRASRVGGRPTSRRATAGGSRSSGRSKPGGDDGPGDLAGGSIDRRWSR